MLLLRLPPDGTPVETAFDANRQQAQASEDHAHVRMYGHGWQCLERTTPLDGDAGRVNRR
jgi:hypothetical protein